ncbi:hypothetical protein FBY12_0566 [Pseudomonas sp. SJZ131]|nr:hypothetical protein FBY12_0566 [Pseudomonas sp. SJZ131]
MIDGVCAGPIASRLTPTGDLSSAQMLCRARIPVGARLARDEAVSARSFLNDPPRSRASSAPTGIWVGHKCLGKQGSLRFLGWALMLCRARIPVGARLARDEAVSGRSFLNDPPRSRASSAPTGIWVGRGCLGKQGSHMFLGWALMLCRARIPVGARLARDEAVSARSFLNDPPPSRASSGPTGFMLGTDALVNRDPIGFVLGTNAWVNRITTCFWVGH